MTRTITDVTVYWDVQDRNNEGWAYRASDADGEAIGSGSIEGVADDDLCGAIDEACRILDIDLTLDDFGKQPNGFVPYGDDEEDGSGRAICGCADGSYVGYNYLIGQEPRRHPDGSVTHCRVVRVDSN